jgi:hypothetical protein
MKNLCVSNVNNPCISVLKHLKLTSAQINSVRVEEKFKGGQMKRNEFDLDLIYGQKGENLLRSILTTPIVEVKRDRMTYKTGNVIVEYECRGKPSGIAITKSEWFSFVLSGEYKDEVIIIIKTSRLKTIARHYYQIQGVQFGGDDNLSKIVKIPVKELL